EHDLAKVGVASSSLVSRSNIENAPVARQGRFCLRAVFSIYIWRHLNPSASLALPAQPLWF
ncbi:hypothetical protein, partial [Pseudomonas xionganensis]|uniref:hypothetical protein n=1 Tax=Pseudomonas xionganensis TaxID=2654845 RepID=UPI001C49AF0F